MSDDVVEKLRRTQLAFPSLTLPEAIQLLGQLHDAGLDVTLKEKENVKSIIVPDACPDCAVDPGELHDDGCDVARCTVCGFQRISCDHEDTDVGWGQVWTGQWPGDVEVAEGLASDLNDLHMKGITKALTWNGERWVANNRQHCIYCGAPINGGIDGCWHDDQGRERCPGESPTSFHEVVKN